jgi:transposase
MLRDLKLKALQVLRRLSRQPRYERVIKLLQSIPGMGLIHAMCFATEMGDIRRFKKLDQLCSMIGLIPTTHASGDKSGVGRITKRGKSQVKSTIIEAAWVAIGADKELRQAYSRLSQRMKQNRAIIRIAKKLVNRIRAVLLQDRPYVQA